jgi:hypothetical protein
MRLSGSNIVEKRRKSSMIVAGSGPGAASAIPAGEAGSARPDEAMP